MPAERPDLVQRARALADEAGFAHSCSDPTGKLLRVLARRCDRAGEIGTGCGVGSAWIVSGLAPGGSLATIERDDGLVRRVRRLFADVTMVRVRAGDWRRLLDEPPFDLLFADAGDATGHVDDLLAAVAPGGLVVLDDLVPRHDAGSHDAGSDDAGSDPLRARWLQRPDLATAEVAVSRDEAVVVAARLP